MKPCRIMNGEVGTMRKENTLKESCVESRPFRVDGHNIELDCMTVDGTEFITLESLEKLGCMLLNDKKTQKTVVFMPRIIERIAFVSQKSR